MRCRCWGMKVGAEWRLPSREQILDSHSFFDEKLDDFTQIASELVGSRPLRVCAGETGDVSYVETCLGALLDDGTELAHGRLLRVNPI